MSYAIHVNGIAHTVDVDGDTPLLWVLRDVLGMTGTKFGSACPVRRLHGHLNGVATVLRDYGRERRNAASPRSKRSAPQPLAEDPKAWLDLEWCSAAIVSPVSHVRICASSEQSHPNDSAIDDAMSGNICRCGTYVAFVKPSNKLQSRPRRPEGGLTWSSISLSPLTTGLCAHEQIPSNLPQAGIAAGGGLMLGFGLPSSSDATAAGSGSFAPNAFIRIGTDGR